MLGLFLQTLDKPNANDRNLLMLASYYAGRAINITKTTAPHALSYTLTTAYGIPHGNAVALFLGSFFELNVSLANSSGPTLFLMNYFAAN